MRRSSLLVASGFLALLLGSLSCHPVWRDAGAFKNELKCGMDIETVKKIAARFGVNEDSFRPGPGGLRFGNYELTRRDTIIWMWFTDRALKAVKEGKYAGPTHIDEYLKHDLCSGVVTSTLGVYTPHEELIGASVLVDGERVGSISRTTLSHEVDISIGLEHEIRIEKSGYEPLVGRVRLTSTDPGESRIQLFGAGGIARQIKQTAR